MKRILLKLSGEALAKRDEKGKVVEMYDVPFVEKVARVLKKCADDGYQLAVVVGAGNIWRGRAGGDMDRTDADRMGMLATVMNAICLKDTILRVGGDAVVMAAVDMYPFAEHYSADAAKAALDSGKIVIFGAGLGIPFLSTDTAGAVRGAEISADAMLMAKNIDYIYTADPKKDANAKPLVNVKASEVLAMNLGAIDATATAFCLSVGMPIRVFGLKEPEDIYRAVCGEVVGTIITAE